MSLFPTKTRLRRLREVARVEVHRYGDGQDYDAQQYRVTATMAEMARAGWVVLPPDDPRNGDPVTYKRAWLITDEGRRILREAK